MGEVAGVAQGDGGTLFRRQGADCIPEPAVPGGSHQHGVDAVVPLLHGDFGHLRNRQWPAAVGAVVVDGFAVGDRQQPAAQVARVAQLWVCAQRGEERLLKAILGLAAADRAAEHRHHLSGMVVEQGLKGWQRGQVRD